MKITIETGGDPNPKLVAFRAFIRRNQKRILAGMAALLILIVASWVYFSIKEEHRKEEDRARWREYNKCFHESGYMYGTLCAKYDPDSNEYNPGAKYTPVPTPSTAASPAP